jgi:hypothetical protein
VDLQKRANAASFGERPGRKHTLLAGNQNSARCFGRLHVGFPYVCALLVKRPNSAADVKSIAQLPERSAISGGTLAARFKGAAWKVAADFCAALRSSSESWVDSTLRRDLDSVSPWPAAMAYHL